MVTELGLHRSGGNVLLGSFCLAPGSKIQAEELGDTRLECGPLHELCALYLLAYLWWGFVAVPTLSGTSDPACLGGVGGPRPPCQCVGPTTPCVQVDLVDGALASIFTGHSQTSG